MAPLFETIVKSVAGQIWIELFEILLQTFWIDVASVLARHKHIFMTIAHLRINHVAHFWWEDI